ncbi:hypothetical protein QJS66_21215 [Kocuria rhizophila]|nr:hypothetical protein QJS66_21215 [Kocuria rhizophila]
MMVRAPGRRSTARSRLTISFQASARNRGDRPATGAVVRRPPGSPSATSCRGSRARPDRRQWWCPAPAGSRSPGVGGSRGWCARGSCSALALAGGRAVVGAATVDRWRTW